MTYTTWQPTKQDFNIKTNSQKYVGLGRFENEFRVDLAVWLTNINKIW